MSGRSGRSERARARRRPRARLRRWEPFFSWIALFVVVVAGLGVVYLYVTGADPAADRRAPTAATGSVRAVPTGTPGAGVATTTPGGTPGATSPPPSAASAPSSLSRSVSPSAAPVVVAAVGDLVCDTSGTSGDPDDVPGPGRCQTAGVASLIAARRPAVFLPLGDLQYDVGALKAFRTSYATYFGRFLPITRPAVGNHEYRTSGAAGYFSYFGSRAGPKGKGWYSFDLGGWHVVALNSNCDVVNCSKTGEQNRWLARDLAAHRSACTLAFWHHPRWSSGPHGPEKRLDPLLRTLVAARADVVLVGHDHHYERFRVQNADGRADPKGVRQFVVGTGGRNLRDAAGTDGSEKVLDDHFGPLFLTLTRTGYQWQFVAVPGTVADSGSATCH